MEIVSKLSSEELLAKLQKYSYPKLKLFSFKFFMPSSDNIAGSFKGHAFNLKLFSKMYMGFYVQTSFSGEVITTPIGSQITGDFKMSKTDQVFALFYALLGTMILACLFFRMINTPPIDFHVMLLLFIVYAILVSWLWYSIKSEKALELYLTEFLKQCAADEKVTVKYARLDEPRILLTHRS